MKSKTLILAPFILIHFAHADNITWDAGPTGTGTDWTVAENWVGDIAPANSGSADIAVFNTLTTGQPTLNSNRGINGIELATPTGGWTLGGTATLSVGDKGIDAMTFEGGTNTINFANIVKASASASTWTFGVSANTFPGNTVVNIGSNIQLHKTAQLQIQSARGGSGGTGTVNITGALSNTTGEPTSGQVKYLGGSAARNTFNVTGLNSYTGNTLISQAVVNFNSLADEGTPSALGQSGFINLVENGSFGNLQFNGTAAASTNRRLTIGLGFAGNTGAANLFNNAADPLHTLSFTDTQSVINGGSGNRIFVLSGGNTGNNQFAQSIDNAASGVTTLTKQGTGRWLLTNSSNTYTGVTTLTAGILGVVKLADGDLNSSIGASSNIETSLVFNGGELAYTGSGDSTDRLFTLNAAATISNNGSGPLAFSNTGAIAHTNTGTTRTLNLGGSYTASPNVFEPQLNETGGAGLMALTIRGGTWDVKANNTFTGNLTINFGSTLSVTSDANLGAGTGAGKFTIAGTLICNEDITLNSARGIYAGSPTAAGFAIIQVAEGKTATHDGVISDNLGGSAVGADGLSKTGPGTLSLGAANTYTGITTIFAGQLKLGASGSIDTSPTLSVRAGATLDLSAKTTAFPIPATQTLTGAGTVTGQSLTVAGNIAPGTSGIGTLSTGSVAMAADSNLTIQINSAAATSDTLAVNGNLNLNTETTLTLSDIAATPESIANGAKLTLATYSGTLTGTFKDRPQGSTVLIGENEFTLSYTDGNAITLTSTNESSADPFTTWIDSFLSLTEPNDKLPDSDPDGDGRSNLEEFAFDGDPTNPGSDGKIQSGLVLVEGVKHLTLTLPLRDTAVFTGSPALSSAAVDGLIYGVRGSLDLSSFTAGVVELTPAITSGPPLNPGWSYRSFRLSASSNDEPRGFLRAEVTPDAP
jgi:fibronectin-binding autotransporter adhesin